MIIIQQSKIPNAQGSFKIKKEDLKMLQQYVENDLVSMEVNNHSKNAKHQQQISHQKTKSEGATPLGTNFAKNHFQGGKPKMQPISMSLINQAQSNQIHNQVNAAGSNGQGTLYQLSQPSSNQSPFLDYQKYLEDEKLFQNQKPKSHMGYYSMGQTPISGGGLGLNSRPPLQSKSPDLGLQMKASQYQSQKHHQNILTGGPQGLSVAGQMQQQSNMVSQSALASYSNVQNLLQQHSNRGINGGQQTSKVQSVTRPSSRKKGSTAATQNLIYDQSLSLYPSLNYSTNNQSAAQQNMQAIYLQKNASNILGYNNPKSQSVLGHKNDDVHYTNTHNNHHSSTIEGTSKDQLNESSNYFSDDPLMKSNQQLLNIAAAHTKNSKQQHYNQQPHHFQSVQDESYLDASVYDQFIQGPHNISQFTAHGGNASAHKMLDDLNSYSQYVQRPLSQNTTINKPSSKLGRQSPAQKNNTTRTGNAQMHSSQPKKSNQRTTSIMQNSLNNSGQKQLTANDRRLVIGRTPSPNFLKRIAGLMNIGNDFMLPQSNMYKNSNTNLIVGAIQSKRSQSKQAFSSNPQVQHQQSLHQHQNQPIQQNNFIHIGPNTIQNLDKNIKQKFLKQQTSVSNQSQISSGAGSIHALGNAPRFKSGSLTTSANTAQNSPRRDQQVPFQRNQAKQQKMTGKSNTSNSQVSAYQSNTDFHQLSDAIKKNQMQQVLQAINPQQKLKIINDIEEKKAMALVKGINDYPTQTQKQANMQHHQLSQQQQYLQQQFLLQPANKMIGEIMEEDPQPLSSHEFMDQEKSFQSDLHHQNYYPQQLMGKPGPKGLKKQLTTGHGHKANSKSISHTPNNNIHMSDGGTGSNGVSNHLLASNGGDVYATQPRQLAGSVLQNVSSINQNDPNNSISLYLEQLQNLRQNQKSQLSHHPQQMIPISQSAAVSPMVNKTAGQFFNHKQQQSNQSSGKQAQQYGMIPVGHPLHQQQQINIKPLLQSQPKNKSDQSKSQHDDESSIMNYPGNKASLNNDSNIGQDASVIIKANKKKNLSGSGVISSNNASEPPKIATPSVDMYKMHGSAKVDEKSSDHNKLQKKQLVINFEPKTPFERELDQKATEIKNQKKLILEGSTYEQIKLQKYKEDSISILKQLQESGKIVISDVATNIKEQSLHSKKGSVDKQRLIIDMGGDYKKVSKGGISIGGPAANALMDPRMQLGVNSPKQVDNMRPPNTLVDEEDTDEILITQEEEDQIKEVISDLNHKAFYGKILKKAIEVGYGDDDTLKNISPRSREITIVMRMIKSSFDLTSNPPVTTTDFYRIGKMLGRGAFGKVNLAMHKLVRKLVAIKSLNKECLTDEAQKQKLMKEVSLLLKLRHNHVVKIYETIETEKHIIIVMELCAGGDLLNYVRKRRRLKEPYAKVIFKQIIDGLCYIHSKFIAHRDIKLDNILLDGKGNVKIGDFGVSKQCQRGQLKMTEQCGTPAYIAPEILKDKGYTFSVDIWSAGVVLFAMLYGTVPFKANNMEELHKLIVKGKYVLKDDISIEARNLLRGLLEVNPEKRLTIKQIYRHKWFSDLDPSLELFNDLERDMIRKEYTYNDPRRYNRNENEEPVDCFTEHNLESVYNSLKNVTSKSIILAPFNSTQSQIMEEGMLRDSVQSMVCEKMMVLKFARRCREIDRQYEFNNNGDLDNGVYHKFINNTDDQDDSGDERANNEDVDKDLLCIPMLLSSRIGEQLEEQQKQKKPSRSGPGGGRSSVDNSFEEETNMKRLNERQILAQKIREGSQIQKDLHRNRKNMIDDNVDPEMVQTFETYQTRYSNRYDQEKIAKLVQYGYPRDYVQKSLEELEPNYCTSGYYLMGMDQNYC